MFSLRSVCERVPPVGPEATVAVARERFSQAPGLRLLPVVDRGMAVGLLTRDWVLSLAEPSSTLLSALLVGPPIAFDADLDVPSLNAELLSAGEIAPLQGFLVLDGDDYFGVGDGLSLLQGVADQADWRRKLVKATRREIELPLGGLLAVGQLLARQPLSPDGAAQLRAMTSAAEAALAVLAEVAAHLEPEAHGSDPARGDLSLAALLDEVDAFWQVQASLRGVRLVASCGVDCEHHVHVDPERFRSVLNTLIGEAMRASDGGVVEARLTAERDGGVLRAKVQVRAPPSNRTEAEPPASSAPSLSRASLAAAVEALQGRLCRSMSPGGGAVATFDLVVPVAEGVAAARAAVLSPSLGHILIVDDNATNRLVAEALCESFGFTCESAASGEAGVEAARLRRFDLVLMDIKMPGMDGVSATRAIRALPEAAGRTPVVALTANADPEAVAGYMAAGMCGLVEKPIKPDALLSAVRAAMGDDQASIPLRSAVG